jgi:hypothetical protein
MIKMLISFTVQQAEWLRAEAKRLGIPISELVRRIIDKAREGKGNE